MSALPTPPEDYDPRQDIRQHLVWLHELLETAASFQDLEDEPPGLLAGYFQHGVTLAQALGRAFQVAAGQAQRRCEAAARARGMEECNRCRNWLPAAKVTLRPIGYLGMDERKVNHELLCDTCRAAEETSE
jgi:hypothetical protein